MRWVTQERAKIDRIACPWLISRFIDNDPEFLFVPAGNVRSVAAATGAIPFDVPGVELAHPPNGCSFDVFLAKYRLDDPALARVADIVRAADNDNLAARPPEAAGLRAISLGLAKRLRDDHARLAHGLLLYDALYLWAQKFALEAPAATSVSLIPTVANWIERARQRRTLARLDARMLRDVGLTRAEIARECAKPFWRA